MITDIHAAQNTALQSKASANLNTTSGQTSAVFIDNRPEKIAQMKLQYMADRAMQASVIQRKPTSSLLTVDEELAIKLKLDAKKYAEALVLLKNTAYSKFLDKGNIGNFVFDNSNVNYGVATQDIINPAVKNTVDITFGPLSMTSIPILVSTMCHEMQHAQQFMKGSVGKDEIAESDSIYGYAKEKSGYIEAAQEIETHWMEIVDAEIIGTHTDLEFMKSRGISISNYWSKMYSAKDSEKKTTKSGQYLLRVKPLVQEAYDTLRKYGIDISTYDKRGGLKLS
jgi:hypothetical protein